MNEQEPDALGETEIETGELSDEALDRQDGGTKTLTVTYWEESMTQGGAAMDEHADTTRTKGEVPMEKFFEVLADKLSDEALDRDGTAAFCMPILPASRRHD